MSAKVLENFISKKIRKGDLYVPSAILLLLKNNGKASIIQIAKLLYIFENKYSLQKYEYIVKNLVSTILTEYSIVTKKDDLLILNSWPLKEEEIDRLIKMCYRVSNGFFRNLPHQKAA